MHKSVIPMGFLCTVMVGFLVTIFPQLALAKQLMFSNQLHETEMWSCRNTSD